MLASLIHDMKLVNKGMKPPLFHNAKPCLNSAIWCLISTKYSSRSECKSERQCCISSECAREARPELAVLGVSGRMSVKHEKVEMFIDELSEELIE